MSQLMSAPMDTDRNLLFGVLALQSAFIDNDQFAEVCAAWTTRKQTPLAELLRERGWISADDQQQIEYSVERHLKRHGGDVRKSLGVVADAGVRDLIRATGDSDVRKSLSSLPPAAGYVLVHTLDQTLDTPVRQRQRYSLTRLHGQGGLGKVWVAHDNELGRDVALKEIKPDQSRHPEAWQRFLKEAQITGQLEHPNIVPVYELARRPEDQQPVNCMRLVRGQTLGEAIAAYLAREKEGKTEPLELRRLLGAFVNVCQAVGYAHSRGVVHRDLKPDNVVLGAFGEVVLLDWGLARLVDDATTREDEIVPVQVDSQAPAEATQAGQQLGTPAYMAPEQAEGRLELIDGRTDVYGLGAILFEILSGRPPHQGSSTAEVLRGIVHGGSPQVRAVNPRVPAALEAICAKAMAKSPSGRYVKATQLADDVQRWLADEPVSAHAEPWSLRAGRWMRKHRTLVASTVAAMTLALVFLATLAILVERQKGELAQQNVALAQAADAEREAKEQANRNFQLAQESVDRNFTEVSEDVLLNEPGFQPLRKQLLQGSREFYQRFIDQRRGDPALRAGLARAYQRLAVITDAIDAKEEAISHQREAVRLYEALQREDHDSESLQQDLALAYSNLGDFYLELDQVSPAERACRSSLELSERLVAAHPSSPTHLAQLVRALHGFALLHLKTGNTFEAENSSPRPGKSSPRFSPKILEALAASSRHEFCEPSAPSMWERSGRKRRSPCCSRRATCSSIQQNEAPRSWSTLPPWRCALEALGPLSATLGWRVTRRRRTRGRKICGKS